jgi:non-heme chloroperoxidase
MCFVVAGYARRFRVGLGNATLAAMVAKRPSTTPRAVDVGEVVLSCVEHGDPDGAPVVLVPGPTDSACSYEGVLEHLPGSIRAIAVSPRGHGDSDKPPSGYGIRDFASDVLALLDALGIERAVLAGHSGSTLVVRRVAIDRAERVLGLVLEASPTSLRGNAGLEAFVGSVVSDLSDPIGVEWARSFVTDTSSASLPPDMVDRLVVEVRKVPARVWREMFAAVLAYDDLDELGRIVAPTLLIWGDGDELVGRDMQERLLAEIHRAELVVYAGAGHTPRWEQAARFASDVAAFVQRS